MESTASRKNDSHAMSRKADNSTRRQRVTNTGSSDRPGFSPQTTSYNRRQSLSRSYDSPEGLNRISQASPKKAGSHLLRRSASPPPTSAIRKRNNSAIGRNQTVLDDAAWMSERIQNLHKTGFFRASSMSKLRDSNDPPAQSRSARKQDCDGVSCSQSLTPLQSPTGQAVSHEDEPLSAFRLSEIILSEEDLLTDISSTCTSTPVSLQSGRTFDQRASDNYQLPSIPLNVERKDSDSAASFKNSPLNVRIDLLHRLEALQYRAELAAKASHSKDSDSHEGKHYCEDPWNGQALHSIQKNAFPSNQSQYAIAQGGAASPIQTIIESTSWPEEPEHSLDSTYWLETINDEVQTKPFRSQLIHSSTRTIRPEYYLPLSKEEEPEIRAVPIRVSSPNDGRKSELRVDTSRRLGLRESSTACQLRYEDSRHGKSLVGHKQTYPARRSLKGSMNPNRPVTTRGISYITVPSTFNSCRIEAREPLSTEVKSSQISVCGGYNGSTKCNQEQSFDMDDLSVEEDGQIRNTLQKEADYDGEVSWISEENVEGFLSSRTFTVDEVDALSTSNKNAASSGSSITSLLTSGRKVSSQTEDHEELLIRCPEESLSSFSEKRNGYSEVTTGGCINESMGGSFIFDHGQGSLQFSQGNQTINNQASSQSQLLGGGSLACSCRLLQELKEDKNWLERPVCQICSLEGKSRDPVLLEHCKPIHERVQAKESCKDVRTYKQLCCEDKHVSFGAVGCKDTDGAQTPTLESQHHGPCHFENSTTSITSQLTSLDATLSSPEIDLTEDRHWPFTAKRCKASPSQNLLETETSHPEHRIFARITRSLSFSENKKNELQTSSKQNTWNDLSELKSTSFSHYWIRNSAYSLDFSELLDNAKHSSRKADQVSFPENFVNIQHGLKERQIAAALEKELLEEVQSQASRLGASDLDKKHGVKHNISSCPDSESCKAASESVRGEASTVNDIKSLQQYDQFGLDNSAETFHRLKDDSKVINVSEDKSNWHQLIDGSEVPRDGKSEMCDKVNHQETVIEKDAGAELGSRYKNEREKIEHDIVKEFSLLEQAVSSAPLNYQNNNSLREDLTTGGNIPKTSCSPENETPSSEAAQATSLVLSVYKNPLWLDENSKDFENDHAFQDQEFVDFTCRSERNIRFVDSDKNRLSFNKSFEEKTWDTYEGMGAFIGSFPNSPRAQEVVSGANDGLLGFVDSSNLSNSLLVKAGNNLKNIVEEDRDRCASVWESQFSESKDRMPSELPCIDVTQKLSAYSHSNQPQQLTSTSPGTTLSLEVDNHAALSSTPVKGISIVDTKQNVFPMSSTPLLCPKGLPQSKDVCKKPCGARNTDGLGNLTSDQVLWPDSTELSSIIATTQDVALLTSRSTENDILQNALSLHSSKRENVLLMEMPCQVDETKVGMAVNEVNHDRKIQQSRQTPGVSFKLPGASSNQLSGVNATKGHLSSNGPVVPLNDEMEACEEVKRVTFVYSDTKEPPQRNVETVPFDLLSNWIWPLFSHATKVGGNLKKREQRQPLIQENSQKDQTDWNKIGKKVVALEAEIDKFKRKNRKLQNLVKLMIRKMKQLRLGFRARKRSVTSRGFMTCFCSARIHRSKSKVLRES